MTIDTLKHLIYRNNKNRYTDRMHLNAFCL